jgi:hypothetical protein
VALSRTQRIITYLTEVLDNGNWARTTRAERHTADKFLHSEFLALVDQLTLFLELSQLLRLAVRGSWRRGDRLRMEAHGSSIECSPESRDLGATGEK